MSEPVEIKCCHGVVVVQPGDRVIFAVGDDFDYDQANFVGEHMEDIELVFVRANSIAVERKT